MIFLLFAVSSSLQINRMFAIGEVKHLLRHRLPRPKVCQIDYDNLFQYKHIIQSTKLPTHVNICYESNRLHLFLHDEERICRCVWDGKVRFKEKKIILKNMLMWWQDNDNSMLDQRLLDYEDCLAFVEIIQDMEQ
jgi:hypothetical protein